MREDTLVLRGAPARALPRANRTWAANRVCAQEGCTTKLSIYNKSARCWQHEPVHSYLVRGRRRRGGDRAA